MDPVFPRGERTLSQAIFATHHQGLSFLIYVCHSST